MSGFEFVFGLFGLLLGLALAEGLGGLARALKASHKVRIGWSTALIGIFVSCDVVTFWMYSWTMRDLIPVSWPVVFSGCVVCAVYYVSASLIFPDDPEGWGDLDGHFVQHHRKVLGGVLFCNAALLATAVALLGIDKFLSVHAFVITWGFFPLIAAAILAGERAVKLICLSVLILLYPLSIVWTA